MHDTDSLHPLLTLTALTVYALLAMLLDSQSRPSYSPSPDVAHVLWMYLWW